MWAAFRNTLEIVGTLGTIEVPHAFVTQTEEECTFYIHKNNERIAVPAAYYNSYALQADAIAKAVYGEQPIPFPISDAISNMKAIDACLNSMENATRVKMN